MAAAHVLGKSGAVDVMVIDRRNHHLFQPLLYQVAMAGLSPAEIAAPVRSLLAKYPHVRVIQGQVERIDRQARIIEGDFGEVSFDYLVAATGTQHSYFGNDHWEPHAPGLKSLAQATEIRRRVLTAF